MPFDPSQPFQIESQPTAGFDPSQPFQVETKPSRIPSESDLLAQQYIAQQQRPTLQKALEALVNPFKGAGQLVGDIAGIVPGVAEATAPNAQSGTTLRSLVEGARRAGTGFINLGRQAVSNTLESGGNPALGLINQALQLRSRTPSQDEVQQAVLEQLTQQNNLRPENQLLQGQISERLAQGTSQAIPLLLPLVGAEERAATLALGQQGLKTAATAITSPSTIYQGLKVANPYLGGAKVAGAEAGVSTAESRQAALNNAIQQQLIKEQAATQQGVQGVAEARGAAAAKGREALAAGRELKTAQGTIAPEIVQAQANIESAAQMPPVILGETATTRAELGRLVIQPVQREMTLSLEAIQPAYTAVEESLPTKQTPLAAQPLFDAAQKSTGELSQGFESYNKGTIKRILDESTRITPVESNVTPGIQQLYDTGTVSSKARLVAQYPELAQPVKGTIPKYTWTELQTRFRQVNQAISQALEHGNVNDARILGDLKDGLNKSMEAYASKVGGDTLELFKKANAQYAEHQNKFGLNRIQTLFRDDVLQNPEYVAEKLINYNNPSQVEAIKVIVSPEEFVPVQAQFAQKLFSPLADVPFDPAHFVKEFSKREARETVKAVFGEEGIADFNQIYEASKSFAKISDLQKTLDALSSQSEKATEAFSKARAGATEAEKVLADKNALKAQLKPLQEAKTRADLGAAQADVDAALKELDRVKNYRDLKDWGTRVSGLNILETALDSQAGVNLLANAGLILEKNSTPKPKRSK